MKKKNKIKNQEDYCFWEQNDLFGKMEAAYGHNRDEWPDEPLCSCSKCNPKRR